MKAKEKIGFCLILIAILLLILDFIFLIVDNMPAFFISLILLIVCGIIGVKLVIKATKDENKETIEKINNDPEYLVEKKIMTKLDEANGLNVSNNTLVNAGSFMILFLSNDQSAKHEVIFTEKAIFTINHSLDTYSIILSTSRNLNITCKEQYLISHSYGKKNASLVGRTVAGGIAGGAVGAVVGAASAVNTNVSGGVTKKYSHNEGKVYSLMYLGMYINSILINNAYISEIEQDSLKFIKNNYTVEVNSKYFSIINPNEHRKNSELMFELKNCLCNIYKTIKQKNDP